MKQFAKRIIQRAGFRVTRWRPASRFEALDDTLLLLRSLGFQPSVIVDVGANVGEWTKAALQVFPASRIHMVEPQSGCAKCLDELCQTNSLLEFHSVAVSRPGVSTVHLVGTESDLRGTGAYVASDNEALDHAILCPAKTLDELFLDRVRPGDRLFLKLDVEGHELSALSGAARILSIAEIVLLEVRFFDINLSGRPLFADVFAYMREKGFELFDISALAGRPRDSRLRTGDVIFVRRDSSLNTDVSWQ